MMVEDLLTDLQKVLTSSVLACCAEYQTGRLV